MFVFASHPPLFPRIAFLRHFCGRFRGALLRTFGNYIAEWLPKFHNVFGIDCRVAGQTAAAVLDANPPHILATGGTRLRVLMVHHNLFGFVCLRACSQEVENVLLIGT